MFLPGLIKMEKTSHPAPIYKIEFTGGRKTDTGYLSLKR